MRSFYCHEQIVQPPPPRRPLIDKGPGNRTLFHNKNDPAGSDVQVKKREDQMADLTASPISTSESGVSDAAKILHSRFEALFTSIVSQSCM